MRVYIKTMGKNKLQLVELHYPNLVSVEFVLDDGQMFIIKDDGSALRIAAANGKLIIEPEASNVIQVKEVD